MATILVIHEVDDVDHWLASTKRAEIFGPAGITFRTFVEPVETHRVGLIVEAPDLETFQRVVGSEAAAEAMAADGVRVSGMLTLVEHA
jgi:hypothetical protein